MKKRILALLLVSLMTAQIIGCANGEDTADTNDTAPTSSDTTPLNETTEPEEEAFIGLTDDLPEKMDFGGETFTILTRAETEYEVFVEDNVDVVDAAIYNRNLALEETLNLHIESIAEPGQWPNRDTFLSKVTSSILAGSEAYNLVMGYQSYINALSTKGMFYSFTDIPNIDLEKGYYYADFVNELNINGNLYFLAGDYSLTVWESLFVMFYNKRLAEEWQLPDMYDLVREGKWTLDTLIELTSSIYSDLDGSGTKNDADIFGYVTDFGNVADALSSAFDNPVTVRSEDGLVLAENNEKTVAIIEKMSQFYTDNAGVYTFEMNSAMTTNPLEQIFEEGRGVFLPDMLGTAMTFREMADDFGILPMPKWDESQKDYQTQAWNGYSVMVVPSDITSLEMTGAFIERANRISYNEVIPTYFDTALKHKYARDDASGEMLDIIRNGIKFNFGYFYTYILNGPGRFYRDMLPTQSTDFASRWKSGDKVYRKTLKNILDYYE